MEDVAKGGSLGFGGPFRPRSGEDRLVWGFVVLSAAVHFLVVVMGALSWFHSKPPISNEWTMDADLVTDLDMSAPAKTALPDAAKAPEAKAPVQLLPQLPTKFAVKEPTKPDEAILKEKAPEPAPKEAKPVEQPKPAEPVAIKTENKDDNKMDQADILKRAALERLRQEEKTAKTTEAPEKDPYAQLAEVLQKEKTAGFGSAAAKGRINRYGALLYKAVRANYSLPEAYNLKGSSLKVVVEITVGERGDLQDLAVKQSSGDTAFDELTLQAAKASAPFPKPPQELAGVPIGLVFTP
jgi:TonB family protein